MRKKLLPSLCIFAVGMAGSCFAAVTGDEAKQLGTTLTPMGAEVAGNADGSIPPYTGGLSKPPAGVKFDAMKIGDPFAAEKPLFSIDAKNMAQYGDKVSPGMQAMLKKYPTFRMDVYKTHRTAAFPDSVYKANRENAMTAKIIGNGDGMEGATRGGVPFPIPKNGYEAMFNHSLRPAMPHHEAVFDTFSVDRTGAAPLVNRSEAYYWNQWYDSASEQDVKGYYKKARLVQTAPARAAGQVINVWYCADFSKCNNLTVWVYTPGQRRTRLAPELAYDTPVAAYGGDVLADEGDGAFAGRMDRYEWKLVGKQEVYVPYNMYRSFSTPSEKLLTAGHPNPDGFRFELHRVWVVEATLAAGKRHIYAKRRIYLDEDSWAAVTADAYDASGNIFRTSLFGTYQDYRAGWYFAQYDNYRIDVEKGSYTPSSLMGCDKCGVRVLEKSPPGDPTNPNVMAGAGIR